MDHMWTWPETSKEALSSGVIEHFIPLQLAKINGGEIPWDVGKTSQ